jgi:protein-tyrosine-phosphatase
VVEQYFAGKGVGISVLANRGRVLQAFEHHRVREVAGAGFYRRSAPLTPDLVHACELIVATLEFSGIAMFEFKVKADGEWVLLEVNARPWGSMPLAVALGVDFPYRWYRLLTAGEEIAAVAYRPGVYGRNLIPDLQNAKIEADLQQLGRIGTAWYLTKVIMEMRRLLTGKEIHDVLVSDDPEPGYFELHEMAAEAWQKLGNALPGSLMRRRVRARARVTSSLKVAAKPAVLLFICQGNICRSPFAEALLRVRVGEAIVEFGSAGMMPRPGRPTPAYGLEAAAAYGVDLSAHRSIWLTREKAEAASLLVVFDEITRSAVMDRYPDLNAPLLLLGDLIGVQHIADPVDGGIDEFRSVYAQIAKAAAELASLLGITQD